MEEVFTMAKKEMDWTKGVKEASNVIFDTIQHIRKDTKSKAPFMTKEVKK